MQPHAENSIVAHIRDEFDAAHPWRGYWQARQADASNPANAGAWNLTRPIDWTIAAGSMTFRLYTWLLSPANQRSMGLVFFVKPRRPPFQFQLAFRLPTILNGTNTFPTLQVNGSHVLDQMSTSGVSRGYNFSWSAHAALNASYRFANNSFAVNQHYYYRFTVESDLNAQWDLLIDGVRPALQSGTWSPGTNRAVTNAWVNDMMTKFGDRGIPIHIRPIFGGTIDFLECAIHDHTV